MFYWLLKYVLLGPLLRALWPTKITGLENIPETGGAVMASNHLAVVDSFFLSARVKRRIFFLAKSDYFTGKGVKGTLKRWFFAGTGQYPIDRSGGSAGQSAINTGVRLLNEGKLLGIYPEGTRSPDGRLHKGKTGVARMALDARVPIIPVAMVGTDRVNPIGSKMWWPRRIEMHFGAPMDLSRYEGLSGDRFVERSITDELMYNLMELSGQQYVDIYAAKAKEKPGPDAAIQARHEQDAADLDRAPKAEAG